MVSVHFKPRQSAKTSKSKPHVLYCTLRIDGVEAVPFSTGVRCLLSQWNADAQLINGADRRTKALNQQLLDVDADLREIIRARDRLGQAVTPSTVRKIYLRRNVATPTLTDLYNKLVEVKTAEVGTAIVGDTLGTWKTRRANFAAFLEFIGQSGMLPAEWQHESEFRHYLRTVKGFTSADYINKQIGGLKAVFELAVSDEWIDANPLEGADVSQKGTGRIEYLDDVHIEKLLALDVPPGQFRQAVDRMIMHCFSGMNQVDLDNFDVGQHLRTDPDGTQWIFIFRQKTVRWAKHPCRIPVLPPLRRVMERYGWQVPRVPNQKMNEWCKALAVLIGYGGNLSTKIGRSTAGTYLLNEGVSMETVSQILGHSSVRTTERTYAFLKNTTIKREVQHLLDNSQIA